MLIRSISSACYVAIVAAFFLLREYVDTRLFQVLIWFFLVVGSFEITRALKGRLFNGLQIFAIGFAVAFVPTYCFLGVYYALAFCALMLVVVAVYALISKATFKATLVNFLPFVYPALFLLTTLLINDLKTNSFIALLLLFVIAPFADVFAYLVGSTIGGKKLCPKLSPKKTWSGAIGGLVGGTIGSVVLYFIIRPTINFFSPVLFFIIVGLVASVLTEIGDLFESLIKRKVGIKDMGKIMPGHGGVLDRIDGLLFASVFIFLMFSIV